MEITRRVYKPRQPRESPLFRLVEQHLEKLLRFWPTRFVRQPGPLRPVVELLTTPGALRVADHTARAEHIVAPGAKGLLVCVDECEPSHVGALVLVEPGQACRDFEYHLE